MACKTIDDLVGKSMADRYINCESVYQFAKELCKEKETGVYAKGYNNALHAIMSAARSEALPAADVRPVVRGRWVIMSGTVSRRQCTACGWDVPEHGKFYSFCPNCGADMRGTDNDRKT